MQRTERGFAPHRSSAAWWAVLVLHVLLAALLWQTLRQRTVTVRHELAALVWVRAVEPLRPPPATAPKAREREAATPARPPVAAPLPVVPVPHESTWVQAPAPVAAAPAASAASEPPPRLLDSEGTRTAIRQAGRQALLQERAAAATGTSIERTDTALAGGVAEAGLKDCAKEGVPGGILGIPLLAAQIASGKCAK